MSEPEAMPRCPTCDDDGYTEKWNDDQTDVVITLCPDCSPQAFSSQKETGA